MDIIITDSALRKFLETPADPKTLSENISLCGPTFDRIKKIDNDYVYDIEAITNRIDTASAQGIAREAAIILTQYNIPAKMINDPYKDDVTLPQSHSKQFHFDIAKDLVVRFTAIALEKVSVKPSSKETQKLLENCGQRAINNCIDITNELTLLYGLPSHIFDLDKLAAQNLIVRNSKAGETVTTLDSRKNTLTGDDIVIEDGSGRLVDLCGVMGGQVAEVDDHTKNILLIVPVYDHRKIRRTSLYLQNRTLAAQLYEKQPDPELCLPVLAKAVQLFKDRAKAVVSSPLFDYYPVNRPPKFISLDFNWLNRFVGVEIERDTIVSILGNLGFGGSIEKDQVICSVPSWRYHDINIKEDLAEEVARIYGYFRLPAVLPSVNLPAESKNPLLQTEIKIKNYLAVAGFTEIYNNSLTSLDLLEKTGLSPEESLKLKNTLSQDFEYLRTSLVPSTLENYHHNQGKVEKVHLFEVANCYFKVAGNKLPKEISHLSVVSDDEYRLLKGRLEDLLRILRVEKISFKENSKAPTYLSPGTTAGILAGDTLLGHIGSIKPTVLRNLDLKGNPTVMELNLVSLVKKIAKTTHFQAVSTFPLLYEDITISSKKPLGQIIETVLATSKLVRDVRYLESFGSKHSFRISFGSNEKNLDQSEIDSLKEVILKRLKV